MRIFVINSGSSSIKYQLFEMPESKVLARGLLERIGESGAGRLLHRVEDRRWDLEVVAPDHRVALDLILKTMIDPETGVIGDFSGIHAVGHRVVHGGEAFTRAIRIDDTVEAGIERCADLAPVHNPPNLMGIRTARAVLPHCPQVAVFDTAFHQTMPPEAYLYALPQELHREHGIRKYGFHGTSHEYVAHEAAAWLKRPLSGCNLVTCHLGNGCSMTSIRQGRSFDTSMGLTPLQGLVMGTRSGDLDPAVPVTLLRKGIVKDVDDLDRMLNRKSGLLGVSGLSNDMRMLEEQLDTHPGARLAVDMFCHRVKFYLGGYMALAGSCDAVVFTGGIGENGHRIREKILQDMSALGIHLDPGKNAANATCITTPESPVAVLVIPTDEEGRIARLTHELCG